MREQIIKSIKDSITVKQSLLSGHSLDKLAAISGALVEALKAKGKVIVFGNGGSAADAQHFAGELVGRFKKERIAFPAISLSANTSALTAIANDYSYDLSFKRQLEAFMCPADVVIGISTSGSAKNVIEAVRYAKKAGVRTIALTGKDGGELSKLADIALIVASGDTPRIQEAHILIIHVICEMIDEQLS